jgi:hypothetical protein
MTVINKLFIAIMSNEHNGLCAFFSRDVKLEHISYLKWFITNFASLGVEVETGLRLTINYFFDLRLTVDFYFEYRLTVD